MGLRAGACGGHRKVFGGTQRRPGCPTAQTMVLRTVQWTASVAGLIQGGVRPSKVLVLQEPGEMTAVTLTLANKRAGRNAI